MRWIGTKEENPEERELPMPDSLTERRIHEEVSFEDPMAASATKDGKAPAEEEEEDEEGEEEEEVEAEEVLPSQVLRRLWSLGLKEGGGMGSLHVTREGPLLPDLLARQ